MTRDVPSFGGYVVRKGKRGGIRCLVYGPPQTSTTFHKVDIVDSVDKARNMPSVDIVDKKFHKKTLRMVGDKHMKGKQDLNNVITGKELWNATRLFSQE